jgi:hypothetical protein
LQRLLSTALVLGLLVATAAAFAVTENLKLTKSPITRTRVSKVISPVCHCDNRAARIAFSLRKRDSLTLAIVDSGRHEIELVADGVDARRGFNVFVWKGQTSEGRRARDGAYYAKVHLANARRTILLPNKIVMDTRPPRILEAKASRGVLSPDGDGQLDSVKITYRLSEPGHALLFLRGHQVVRTLYARKKDSLGWYGRVDGVPLRQGLYRLRLGAVDVAGNVTGPARGIVVPVRVRYIALARHNLRVKAGTRFGVGVDTDAKSYRWRFAGRAGAETRDLLVVKAAQPGRYRLVVTENGHRDVAHVVVVPRR